MRKPILSSRSDEPAAAEQIEDFLVGLAERVDGLQDAEFKGDLKELAAMAHALGTTARGLGFDLLPTASSKFERPSSISPRSQSGSAWATAERSKEQPWDRVASQANPLDSLARRKTRG